MKKRIWLILLSIILVIFIALFLFRHIIIGHALKISINKKTKQTVALNIGDVHYNILNSTVTFANSDLSFNNIYLNKEKTIELSQLKFDEISLHGISVFRLIFKEDLVAKKFFVAKPTFWFEENHNPQQFKKRPREIVKSLKEHSDLLGDLVIIVDEIEITHGNVDLTSFIDSDNHNGSAKFKLILRNFNTSKEHIFEEDRFLFAKEHFFKLSNFTYSLPNGDQLSFDSIVFGSESDNITVSNIVANVMGESIHKSVKSLNVQINELLVGGIDFEDITELHEINIEQITISNVIANIIGNENITSKSTPDSTEKKSDIKKVFDKINLGNLMLNNINLLAKKVSGDTIAEFKKLDFQVSNIIVDSSVIASKIPKLDFETIDLKLAEFILNKKTLGLDITFSDFIFNENTEVISISDLHLDDKVIGKHSYLVDADLIELSGVSIEDYLNKKLMKVGLTITNPVADIDIIQIHKRKSSNKNFFLDNIEFAEIIISNGKVHIAEENKLDLNLNGLSLSSGQINLGDFKHVHNINTNKLKLSLTALDMALPKKKLILSTKGISVMNNDLNIVNISADYVDPDRRKSSLDIIELQLNQINFSKLISGKEINVNKVKIIKPQIVGSIAITNKKPDNKTDSTHSFPYVILINDFDVIDGGVNFNIDSKDGPIDIKSNFNIRTSNIDIPNFNDSLWYENLDWELRLSNSKFAIKDYHLNFKKMISDKNKQLLSFEKLQISDNEVSSTESKIEIVDFRVDNVDITGLNYNLVLEKKTPIASSLSIKNPNISLKIDNRIKVAQKGENNIGKSGLPFVLDEFDINNLSLIIEKVDSSSISNISIGQLDFGYQLDSSQNLIDDIDYLDIANFRYSDTIENIFSHIGKIEFDRINDGLSIANIDGGNIVLGLEKENYMSYLSSGVDISKINVSSSLPHNVMIGDIDIVDFQIDINNHVDVKKNTKSSIHSKAKFPDLLKSISIGEIVGNSIDLNHSTISDTSVNKMALKNLGFLISDILVDSNSLANNSYELAKHISLNLRGNEFVSKDSLYATSVTGIRYNFSDNKLSVDSLMMKPRYQADEFFKKAVYQTGKMDVVAASIVCSNFRLNELLSDGRIHMGAVDVMGLEARIFRNKKYEMNPNAYKKMPQEALFGMARTLIIDSLKTHDSYIQYQQLSEKSIVPGEIFLNKFNLSVTNISNDLSLLDTNSLMVAKLNAMLLGEAVLKLNVNFPLLSSTDDYEVSGNISELDFTKLNSMTQNLAGITMKKGTGSVDIPLIKGNNVSSDGSILFKYKKLKIELYDRDKAQNTSGLTGSMANLLLNDIFIRSNNPGFLGKTRQGEVYFKRNTQKSIVYNIWKSVFSGIMSTMGYNNKEQRQEKKARRRSKK
ncbi:MAG: hypothetical protein HQ521_14470 [Bacteroidetes bacterium]|nr:hypothetical protein [Bacteroidota bacterium]